MLRPLIAFSIGAVAATLVVPQPRQAQACAYMKGLSQNVSQNVENVGSTSFLEGGRLPLGLGAGAVALGAVGGALLWQHRRRQGQVSTPTSQLELEVVLPESDATVSSNAKDATPIV